MRTALIYNFLLEATIIASIGIVLMLIIRKLFRKQLGNRAIAFAWLLVAIRLLCPLSLPNPLINEIRSPHASDQAIRPIAGQVKVRVTDFVNDLQTISYRQDWDRDGLAHTVINDLERGLYNGRVPYALMWGYAIGAGCVAAWFVIQNVRFRHMLKAGRVEPISGEVENAYHELCKQKGIKPLPVYYTDPLPSACLVGVVKPYIALPLTSKPHETIQVLTHEICHYKGWDHIWGVIRLLCCIVHWFNPLVWIAANASMADSELACDERVIRNMEETQRQDYASVLVLAASRRNAPGMAVLATGMTMTGKKLRERVRNIVNDSKVLRWFAITFAAMACMLLVCAFATSEYFPKLKINTGIQTAKAVVLSPVSNEEEAIRQAEEIWSCPYLNATAKDIKWIASQKPGGFTVEASHNKNNQSYLYTQLLPNGTPIKLINYDQHLRSIDSAEIPIEHVERTIDDLAEVALNFMDAVLPGHSNRAEAFQGVQAWMMEDVTYVSLQALVLTKLGIEPGYTFYVRVDNETPQIVYYQMEQPIIAEQWNSTMPDLSAPDAYRIHGILARNRSTQELPGSGVISVEEAIHTAIQLLCTDWCETESSLRRYEIEYAYVSAESSYDGVSRWNLTFSGLSETDDYYLSLDAQTGEVLYLSGRGQGNG